MEVHQITIPGPTIGIDQNAVHYIEPTMRYIRERVNLIISGEEDNEQKLQSLNTEYLSKIERLIKDGSDNLKTLIDSIDVYGSNVDILARISISYQYGKGTPKNECISNTFLTQALKLDGPKANMLEKLAKSKLITNNNER